MATNAKGSAERDRSKDENTSPEPGFMSAIELLVHVRRCEDGVRRVESIAEISGMEGAVPLLQDIFVFHRRGRHGKESRRNYL